ncbi:hypothetical protein [Mariniphaga sediminis]|uniref:hypothetical protein n=1 Tax=Mariniphaga sediminis TaxID=1628158 RepID=UPI003564B210
MLWVIKIIRVQFFKDGTASYFESGEEYDMMKSRFSFLTRVLDITVDKAKQML